MESVAGLDRTTHPSLKNETAYNPYKSNSIPLKDLIGHRKSEIPGQGHLHMRWNVEITLTQNKANRKLGSEGGNAKFKNSINNLLKKYAKTREIFYYLVYENHKQVEFDKEPFLHAHGIISFHEKYDYCQYLQKVATTIKWFYRQNIKANWCRISSLYVTYPISEGNVDRKIGNFHKWYDYIHKIDDTVTNYPIENNIVEKNLKFRKRFVNSEFFDIFYIEDSDSD